MKTCISCPVLSQDSQKMLFFSRTTIINAKNFICKKLRRHIHLFFTIAKPKNKDIALKFGMSVVYMLFLQHAPPFFIASKLRFYTHLSPNKSKFCVLEPKIEKKIIILSNHFVERSISRLMAFFVAFYFKPLHSRNLKTIPAF